jgi:hypothetical protein
MCCEARPFQPPIVGNLVMVAFFLRAHLLADPLRLASFVGF